jgi:hypothetical protein
VLSPRNNLSADGWVAAVANDGVKGRAYHDLDNGHVEIIAGDQYVILSYIRIFYHARFCSWLPEQRSMLAFGKSAEFSVA